MEIPINFLSLVSVDKVMLPPSLGGGVSMFSVSTLLPLYYSIIRFHVMHDCVVVIGKLVLHTDVDHTEISNMMTSVFVRGSITAKSIKRLNKKFRGYQMTMAYKMAAIVLHILPYFNSVFYSMSATVDSLFWALFGMTNLEAAEIDIDRQNITQSNCKFILQEFAGFEVFDDVPFE
jgi:hypothetical protein